MNPKQAFANRTARLLAEGAHKDRLAYSTATPPREHMMVVEMEADLGYRTWSSPMPESKVNSYIDSFPEGYMLSDVDHAYKCWCGGEINIWDN